MTWTIKYYNDKVQKDVLSLPNKLRARYFKLAELMREHGANLGGTQTSYLRDGLSELRLRGQEGIARVMYCTVINNKIVMLHCFVKKSQKTPKKDLDIALKRLKEVKNHDDT